MDDAEALARRNRELSILNTIAADLNRELDLRRALETTLRHVADLCGLRTGWVWLLDATGEPGLAASLNLPPALACAPERMRGTCYCLDAYRAGALGGAANVSIITCSRLKNLVDGTDGLRFHASVPLYAQGRPLGVLNVASPSWEKLTPGELRLLYTVGDLLSIAVERARLFARGAELGALEERNRLAREIHDTLAQALAAIALKLEAADALLEGGGSAPAGARAAVAQALGLTRRSLDEARRSVLDLRPAPLDGRGLAAALRELAAEAADAKGASAQGAGWPGLEVSVQIEGDDALLPPRVTLGLYRVAQEAVANALRHGGAARMELRLAVGEGSVSLAVSDDGRGFSPDEPAPGRFGLLGAGERARLLGGELRVESAPGAGTRLVVEVPL
jgi:two-component system NarL family sensor kinase